MPGIAEGRGTDKGVRNLRSVYEKTLLVVDECSLASTEQMRDLLRIATTLRTARVVLVGDEKQLDGVEAGTPFALLQRAGMQTAVMNEIVRQRDAELKEAVRAGLAGDVKTAFQMLGNRVSEVTRDHLGADVAESWLERSPDERERTGVIAPTRALRDEINERIRGCLIEEGTIHGLAMASEKLISRGMTNAEMAVPSNYAEGDTVVFNRRYKTLGVEKGDEREVAKVDRERNTVHLRDREGHVVEWRPYIVAAAKGGVEVYRSEATELRAGDRVRFTRNDPASGLVNGQVADVGTNRTIRHSVPSRRWHGAASNGERSPTSPPGSCLGVNRSRISGAHGGQRDRRDGGKPPTPDDATHLLCRHQPGA